MSDYVAAFLISFSFIAGFWTGVDWYRRKIMEDNAQETCAE